MERLTRQSEYLLPARRITGSHEEKLDQIEEAIRELLEIKRLECSAAGSASFIPSEDRSHWFAMTVTIVLLLIVLVVLLRAGPAYGQTGSQPSQPAAEAGALAR